MIRGRQGTGAALAVGFALAAGGLGFGAGQGEPRLSWSPEIAPGPERAVVRIPAKQTVPVIKRADVLVIGSSLDGCFLTERIAREGLAVVLASADTSLPREIAIALRPWVATEDLCAAPDAVKSYLARCEKQRVGNEIILNMIQLTEGLEDRILDAGAGLLYDVMPCGVQAAGRRVTAVIFACKGGLVAIEAGAIVDCTPDARVAALAGADVVTRKSADDGVVVHYSMLCENPPGERALAVKGVPELVDDRVVMHGDFAEFRVRLPASQGLFRESAYGLEARRVAANAAAKLKESGALKKTTFVRGGDVVLADATRGIVSRSTDQQLSVDACRPKGIDNLLVCGSAADVADAVAATWAGPFKGPSFAPVLEKVAWRELAKPRRDEAKEVRLSASPAASGEALAAEARFVELGPVFRTDADIPIDGARLPVIAACDVLVVGAGTSGVPAALVAAEKGASTIVVEKYGDVGGTHTLGGVCKYWFGRNTDFVRRLDKDAGTMMTSTGMPKCMGMLDSLMKAGAQLLTHCMAVGTVVEGQTVVGVVVVTPEGLRVIMAKRVVDATGDGDIAARAGAPTTYGAGRDAMTLWYSFARFVGANPEAARHFDCVVDLRDATDMTRAMISSRRRGRGRGPNDFPQYYLTPRESRHVQGRITVTHADVLSARLFRDAIVVCKSNFDIKGISGSDLSLSGYGEPDYVKNYSVQIPYGALLPAGLENILVIGKAYAITHDAFALARMQRDLMAMGGAAGLAAAQAVRNNEPLSAINVKALQNELVGLCVLTEADLESIKGVTGSRLPPLDEPSLRRRIGLLAEGRLELDGKVGILARPQAAVPLLKEALLEAGAPGNLEVAKALCFLGDKSGAGVLLAEIERQLRPQQLPLKIFPKQNAQPDHGYAPPLCFLINSLGRLGDARVIPPMTEAARRVKMNPAESDMMFNYVFSIAYAAERLADPACVEALTILAAKPGIRGGLLPLGTDPRKTLSPTADRYAYLEFCVGRALARCGSRQGYEIVMDYVHDIRAFLARSAHDELVDLAGRDLGYDRAAWRSWLASAEIRPRPYTSESR